VKDLLGASHHLIRGGHNSEGRAVIGGGERLMEERALSFAKRIHHRPEMPFLKRVGRLIVDQMREKGKKKSIREERQHDTGAKPDAFMQFLSAKEGRSSPGRR